MRGSVILAFSLLLVLSLQAHGQEAAASEAVPLHISSLGTGFATQVQFTGTYEIHPFLIKVGISDSFITIHQTGLYMGRRYVDSVRVGLATTGPDGKATLAATKWSEPLFVERVMRPGDRHELPVFDFVIPKDGQTDLAKHWLVVQIMDIPLDVSPVCWNYAFAYGDRQMFSSSKDQP
jgi:hypothetical protein